MLRPLLLLALLAGCASTVGLTDAGAAPDAESPPVIQVASAGTSTCALRRDGRVRCWSWYWPDANAAPPLVVREVAGLDDAREIAVYGNRTTHGCAVRAAGGVVCWEGSATAALAEVPVAVPVAVPAQARHVAAGAGHACAIDQDGAVWCWGDNSSGQIGAGEFAAHPTPTRVAGLGPAIEIDAAVLQTCARTGDGAVWCWGRNYAGALGDGLVRHRCVSFGPDEDCSAVPVRVAGITAADGLSVGINGGCATQRGEALCWGWGIGGRLGSASDEDQPTPRAVPGITDATAVFVGTFDGCAIRAGGVLTCWGLDFGDPADPDGGVQPRLAPTAITALSRVVGVTGGWNHKCALQADGAVRCWGARSGVPPTLPPISRAAPLAIAVL